MSPITDLYYCYYLLAKICQNWLAKLLIGLGLSGINFLFDGLLKAEITAVAILIVMDFFLGTYSAWKTGDEIRSGSIFRTAIKFVVYMMLISGAFLTETATGIGFFDETIIAFLAITELISILEHAGELGMAIPANLLNKLKTIKNDK